MGIHKDIEINNMIAKRERENKIRMLNEMLIDDEISEYI